MITFRRPPSPEPEPPRLAGPKPSRLGRLLRRVRALFRPPVGLPRRRVVRRISDHEELILSPGRGRTRLFR